MTQQAYQDLAQRLDTLPNGYPPTEDGVELRLLALLFTPEEADLASKLRLTLETSKEIAGRLDRDQRATKSLLKTMLKKGLISAGRIEAGFGFGLLPFVVGIYEYQAGRIDSELARLFEEYYNQAFGEALSVEPAFHRVVPVKETISQEIEIRPHEDFS